MIPTYLIGIKMLQFGNHIFVNIQNNEEHTYLHMNKSKI